MASGPAGGDIKGGEVDDWCWLLEVVLMEERFTTKRKTFAVVIPYMKVVDW